MSQKVSQRCPTGWDTSRNGHATSFNNRSWRSATSLRMNILQLESAARRYCEAQGLEPDEHVTAKGENGQKPRWQVVAATIRTQDEVNCIIDEVKRECAE